MGALLLLAKIMGQRGVLPDEPRLLLLLATIMGQRGVLVLRLLLVVPLQAAAASLLLELGVPRHMALQPLHVHRHLALAASQVSQVPPLHRLQPLQEEHPTPAARKGSGSPRWSHVQAALLATMHIWMDRLVQVDRLAAAACS